MSASCGCSTPLIMGCCLCNYPGCGGHQRGCLVTVDSPRAVPGKDELRHPHFEFIVIYLFWPLCVACGNLNCRTKDGTCAPCSGGWILNHWTEREVPRNLIVRACSRGPDKDKENVKRRCKDEGLRPLVAPSSPYVPSARQVALPLWLILVAPCRSRVCLTWAFQPICCQLPRLHQSSRNSPQQNCGALYQGHRTKLSTINQAS